ncbi:hypothetical protein OOZ19_16685 [Saccharopolyspora sp. NFXS83]|uniref:MmyB family transcriptional regulator n=1 Tax=Saccharopolyspora sp. NFXS83 TaxID=2993560 RepID=UPI00224A7EBE|nr:hypothetical protein [Saccharopolyspora sp. NFXS83]MCX2731879.1 hypothetical protein [Saccharopolyspora sp. NFXS83]
MQCGDLDLESFDGVRTEHEVRRWAAVAADTVAMPRLDAGRHPDDPKLSALNGESSIHSGEFRRWWPDHRVHRRTTGTKGYRHPLVGELAVTYQALQPAGDPEQTLFVCTTEPDSPSQTSLRLLAQWNGPDRSRGPAGKF